MWIIKSVIYNMTPSTQSLHPLFSVSDHKFRGKPFLKGKMCREAGILTKQKTKKLFFIKVLKRPI